MGKGVALFGLLSLLWTSIAYGGYGENSYASSAVKSAWNFDRVQLATDLVNARKLDPNSGVALYAENLGDFLTLIESDDPNGLQGYIDRKDARLELLEKAGTSGSWYLFCKGEIRLHTAFLYLKFGENVNGGREVASAYNILSKGQKADPGFLPFQKSLLLLRAGVGSVPSQYSGFLSLLGFKGDLKGSMSQFQGVISGMEAKPQYQAFAYETQLIYSYLLYYLMGDGTKAWTVVQSATNDWRYNPTSAFARAHLGMRLKHNNEALAVLEKVVSPTTPPVITHLDYLRGLASLQNLSPIGGKYFSRYLRNHQGKSYRKDAFMKLGWAYLLVSDTTSYRNCASLVVSSGKASTDEDKNALLEISRGIPNIQLLRARLSYDGGFYSRALLDLNKVNLGTVPIVAQAEYWYRKGRIYDGLKENTSSLNAYLKAIDHPGAVGTHFGAASCLYMGLIYERTGQKALAIKWLNESLDKPPCLYKASFDQSAKAALIRLGG